MIAGGKGGLSVEDLAQKGVIIVEITDDPAAKALAEKGIFIIGGACTASDVFGPGFPK